MQLGRSMIGMLYHNRFMPYTMYVYIIYRYIFIKIHVLSLARISSCFQYQEFKAPQVWDGCLILAPSTQPRNAKLFSVIEAALLTQMPEWVACVDFVTFAG